MGKIHLQHVLTTDRWGAQTAKATLCMGADAIDPPNALLHRRWSPRNSVVMDVRAERMQILAFLQKIGRHEHQWISRHAELTDDRLVELPRHPADGLLLPQELTEHARGLGERFVPRVRFVDIEQQLEILGNRRELVERAPVPFFKW